SSYQKEWDKFESDASYANSKTIQEMKNLVGRVIGQEWISKFQFEIRNDMNGNDVFEIENGNGVIIIRGNDGVSLASGFNYYLKNYASVDYNPLFDSNTDMQSLVKVDKKIVKETEYDVRYALNFCTYSYTMAFWGWDEYQEFLDWAAMNGVNVVLDIVGQEEVLRQTLKQYNFTDDEIKEYIAGPGYFAWFYMQNLYSFGGPLPDNWFEQRVDLGRKMHDRMQAFGIDPVIQGFSGQVPLSFDDKNDGAVLTPIDQWPSYTRPAIIKTYLSDEEVAQGKKDYFKDMAKVFYDAQKNVFGDVSNYYAADPFHEGGNAAGLDIANIFSTVQTEMIKNNEDAIWVLQQWQGNLNDNNLKGLVKPEQALALDLHANKNPEHGVMEKYSVPWVWNMLHNFGGRMGLDGDLETIATDPAETMVSDSASQMVGIGITPEALENSPIMYELLFDMTWERDPINLTKWVEKYAERRAGGTTDKLQEAWDILRETAYNQNGKFQGAAETVINARPGMNFTSASTWGHSTISYEKTELDKALQLLIDNYDEFKNSPAYRYDIADVAEQVLCNAAVEYHKLMVAAYNAGDSTEFKRVSDHFIELISLSDKILGSTDEFMAGTWVNDARDMLDGADDWTKDLFEFNARALITTWGGQRSGQLKDYSNRKWAGLTEEFYQKRWEMWISNRQAELDNTSKDPVAANAESNWFLWEWQWANRKSDDGFALATTPNYSNLKEYATTALKEFSTTSLKDFGSSSVEEDINISEGKLFTTNPDTSEELRKKLTDGEDESVGWEVNDANEYAFTLDLEGTYEVNSIEIYLKNLAESFKYNYKVEILNAATNEWQVIEANSGEETMSRKTIVTLSKDANKEATQVRITMKNRDTAKRTLLITELRVMGKALNVPTYYNVAKGLIAESTKPTENSKIEYITDDDVNTLWKTVWKNDISEMYPATVTLDLKNIYDVSSIELYLEDTVRSFKFKIYTVDAEGNEKLVLDKTGITETLNEKVFKVSVNEKIAKVKVVYEGTTGEGPYKGASPAMTELKVLSLSPQKEVVTKGNQALNKPVKASSTQAGKDTNHLNDGNTTTSWNFDGYSSDKTPNVEIDLQG
ncbi:MAG: alpha-N-acetylglucosaminidase TIM-barrel domain-containing protein, partial [Longicatena sp.]